MNIYVTDEQVKRMKAIHDALATHGVRLADNRGNQSDSLLIREALEVVDIKALVERVKARKAEG